MLQHLFCFIPDCTDSKCPSEFGYILIPEICFCIKWYDNIVYHSQSKEFCRNDGAQLVRINSFIKQLYVNDYLSEYIIFQLGFNWNTLFDKLVLLSVSIYIYMYFVLYACKERD